MRTWLAVVLVLHSVAALALSVRPEVPVTPAELAPSRFTIGSNLATNGETYLAVWTDLRTRPGAAYASRLRADGTRLDPVGIRIAPNSYAGAVVWNGSAFLLTYLQDATVMARTLTPEGILGEPHALFTTGSPASQFRMRMATNGDSALLVTSDHNGILLDPDGRKRREIDFGWKLSQFAVGASGSTYLVASPRFNLELKTQIVTAGGELGATQVLMDTVRNGVDVSGDGERFLVAWARGNLYAQFLTREGAKIDTPIMLTDVPNVNASSHFLTRAIRRGDEYVLLYQTSSLQPSGTLRLGNDGSVRGPFLANPNAHLGDIVATSTNGAVLASDGQALNAAFFDAGAPAPLRDVTPVSLAGKQQGQVQLARLGSGLAVAWRTDADVPQLSLSRGPGSTPVTVVEDYATLVDAVADDGTVWVFWTAEEQSKLFTRRFTETLEAIDAEPVFVLNVSDSELAVAAGGGVAVVVRTRSQGPYDSEPEGAHVEAHILHGMTTGVTATNVAIASLPGADRVPAIAWTGEDFLIAWANPEPQSMPLRTIATDDVYTGIQPDDRILAVHLTTAGDVRESQPIEVTASKHIDVLRVANGIAVWQTYESSDLASRRHTYAVRIARGAIVADLGGENTYLSSVAPDGGGFVLTRALPVDGTTIAPEVLTVSANLAVTGSAQLPPITVDSYYDDINPYDAEVLGGPERTLGYSRIEAGAYGHEQRVFLRQITETRRRRAVRFLQ